MVRNRSIEWFWLVAILLLEGCARDGFVAASRREQRLDLLRSDLEQLMAKHGVDAWGVVEAFGPAALEVPCLPVGGLGPVDEGILVNLRADNDGVILQGRQMDLGAIREGGRLAVVSSNGVLGQIELAPGQQTNLWLIVFGQDQVRCRRLMDPTVYYFTRSPEKR